MYFWILYFNFKRIKKLLPCRLNCTRQDLLGFNFTSISFLNTNFLPFLTNPSPCFGLVSDIVLQGQAQNVDDFRSLAPLTPPPNPLAPTPPPNILSNITNQSVNSANILSNLSNSQGNKLNEIRK